jgi:hypothetical protein
MDHADTASQKSTLASRKPALDLHGRLGGLAVPLVLWLAFVAFGALVLALSPGSATLIALVALGISLYNTWRAELRPARVSTLLVDHPTKRVAGNELAVRLQVSQPLVLENTGGRPCVLAGVELPEPWSGGGNWFGAAVSLRDVAVPMVLRPREPVVCRLVLDLAAYGTASSGLRFDLAAALDALRPEVPKPVTVVVTYAGDGRTRHATIDAALNADAVSRAFRSLIGQARWTADAAPDLRMPGDEEDDGTPGRDPGPDDTLDS